VGLAGNMHGAVRVDDGGASGDNDRVIGKSGGEGEGGSGSLIGVCVCTALLPCVLLGLASGRVLATVRLLLLLAFLLQPIPPLLLLLELEVPWVALDGTNLVHMVARLLLPQLVLLPCNEHHSFNVSESGKGVFLLFLFLFLALYREGRHLDGCTHVEYLCEDVHVLW